MEFLWTPFYLNPYLMLFCLFFPIYIKAEPHAASAPSGEVTRLSMSAIVKAALTFQEGISGLMPLALQSQNLGLHIKHKCIRERQAIMAVSPMVPLSPRGKGLRPAELPSV